LSVITAILFLIQGLILEGRSCAEPSQPNPLTKINLIEPGEGFKKIYEVFCLALFVYRLDAVERCPKETVIKKYGDLPAMSGVTLDLSNIDAGKKGWTRYYPFSIDGKDFVARIFLTKERFYQPRVTVLFEAAIENPDVTFQILPGINAILEDCRIKPRNPYPDPQTASSL